jgi:Tfp pilus assembly protein PilO
MKSRAARGSAFGARAPLIAALTVVLLGGIAVLVAYHGFYDARFRALESTRAELTERRDALAASTESVKATEVRLRNLQKDLETFNRDVLGTRKERLAAIIEDVYALTQKAGLVPGTISYTLDETAGTDRLALAFSVQGRYADVKKLLFAFENNPRFLLLENVSVATDDAVADVLRLNLVVSHHFRPDAPGTRRAVRAARPAAPRGTPAATKPTPSAGVPE